MAFAIIYFDENVCTGCNYCIDVCMCDAFVAGPDKGSVPIMKYPDECWFCGCCVTLCPLKEEGAIEIVTPFRMRGAFKKTPSASSA